MKTITEKWINSQVVKTPSIDIKNEVKEVWDKIAKPLDSLGVFENIIGQIGAIQGKADINIDKKIVIVMCADNGIVEEGVSQSGQEVTRLVAENMGKGIASVCKMSAKIGVDVLPVDIGVNCDRKMDGVRDLKVLKGTKNFAKTPAMTEDEMLKAIGIGIDLVCECKENGYGIIALGEMGIGNTTTSSAVISALLGLSVEETTGKGAGLNSLGLERKLTVIKSALEKYQFDRKDTLKILASLGGLDIAGMVGVCIGGALYGLPIVLDGVVSMTAALVAERLKLGVSDYLIASHISREPANSKIIEELNLYPVINADMALGEGTGAVMMFSLLDLAMTIYKENTTFKEIKLEQYERFESEA